MVTYNNVPGTDSSFNFPPEVRLAAANSQELLDKIKSISSTYLGVLANNTDLNTIYPSALAGTYTLSGSSTYVNSPALVNGTAILEVIRGGSSTLSVIQRITAGNWCVWREAVDAAAGTWSTWTQVETTTGADGKIAAMGPAWAPLRSIPSNGDLNTYRIPGVSRIRTTDTSTIQNLPPGMRISGIFENVMTGDGTDTIFGQRVIESGPGARFCWRSAIDSVAGTFTPWSFTAASARTVTEWHVFLVIGQSNASGRAIVGTPAGGKYVTSRIAQYGATRKVFETATVPLDMRDAATGLSPATTYAQNYLRTQPDHVGVLLIPSAIGSTGFTNNTGTYTWTPNIATNPAFDLPALSVAQTQAALTAARATGSLAELKGILFHQGEQNSTMSLNTYATNLDNLIGYMRTQLGITNLPFLVGQMTPEGIAATNGRPSIDLAHQQTPTRMTFTGFAPATTDGYNPGDTTHMSQVGVDYLGRTYLEAYGRALLNAGSAQAEALQNGRLAALEVKAGFTGPVLSLQDDAVKGLLANPASVSGVELVAQASTTGKALNTAIKAIASTAADGVTYAKLGVIPSSSLPPLVIIDTTPVASQAAMLALTAQRGDVAIRTDLGKSFILSTDTPTVLADWKELLAPGLITSVAGKVGVVTLVKADVGLSNVDNTSDATKPVSAAQQTALNLKLDASANRAQSITVKPETDAPSTYPIGFSSFSVGAPEAWTVSLATISTFRTGAGRTYQMAVGKADALTWIRSETDGDVWIPWTKLATQTLLAGKANLVHTHALSDLVVTTMGSGQDLNTYSTMGIWHQPLNAQATLVLNYPEAAAGLLEVYAVGTYIYQRYWVYAANGADFYWRAQYNAGAWTAWQRAANDSVATASVPGLMSAADKTLFDTATSTVVNNAMVKRSSGGFIDMPTPTAAQHGVRKDYVDGLFTPAPNGLIGTVLDNTLSAARNTVDSSCGEVTVPVVNGRTYRIMMGMEWYAVTTANMGVDITFRQGGTTGVTGTVIDARTVWSAPVVNVPAWTTPWVKFKATSTGNLRFSVSSVRSNGSGDYRIVNNELTVEDLGSLT